MMQELANVSLIRNMEDKWVSNDEETQEYIVKSS